MKINDLVEVINLSHKGLKKDLILRPNEARRVGITSQYATHTGSAQHRTISGYRYATRTESELA